MSIAKFVGGTIPALWSNPSDWSGNIVPGSNSATNVILSPSVSPSDIGDLPTEDLGSANNPFIVHDITSGLGVPAALKVTGFLRADNLNDLTIYTSDPLFDGPSSPAGSINISRDANNTAFNILGDDSTVRIGYGVGGSTFSFGEEEGGLEANWAENAKLILIHPPKGDLPNAIDLPPPIPPLGFNGTDSFSLKIELGKLHFDQASFIPSALGSSSGDIQLSDKGKIVYNLSNVTMPNPTNLSGVSLAGTLSTGYDPTTGYDYVSYSHT
jgi:hypothetical protein